MPDMGSLLTACAFAAGLAVTLALASVLTPAHWWRRPNARALALVAGGTWCLGSLLAGLVPAAASASAPVASARNVATAPAYQVFRALNLRDGTGTSSRRLAVLPAGAIVKPTGTRAGDWWEVRAQAGGRQLTGWASSLWLRRADEGRH